LIREGSVCVLEKASPLSAVLKNVRRDGADGRRLLRMGEAKNWKLVQVTAFPETLGQLQRAIRPVLGADLPAHMGQATAIDARRLLRIGPEQFWIITPDSEDIAPYLQSALTPAVGSLTTLSHSRTCIWIDGARSREVLEGGISIDLHPEVFRPNFFGLTDLHHTPITIYRSGDDRYELYVLRTFALWTWEWLVDAALPFGYEIVESREAPWGA
jgi:sarcosine oxidase subunit gamma